jgi:two-component system NtrC family sensor kinase
LRRIGPLETVLILCLLPPALVLAAFLYRTYQSAYMAAEASLDHHIEISSQQVANSLQGLVISLRLVDRLIEDLDSATILASRKIWGDFEQIQQGLDQADSLFVVDRDGVSILTTRVFPSPPVDFSDRDYYLVHRENPEHGVFVSDAYIGRISQQPIFNVAIRREDGDGRFNGVLGSSLSLPYFEDLLRKAPSGMSVALVKSSGAVLSLSPEADDLARLIAANPQTMDGRWTSGSLLARAGRVDAFPLSVWASLDKATVVRDWLDDMTKWILFAVVLTSALMVVCWYAVKHAQAERVALIRLKDETTQRLEMEARLRHSQRLDSLGQLTGGVAHDFNNILHIMGGGVERIRRHLAKASHPPDLNGILDNMQNAARHGASLTRQLLGFARRQQLNPEQVHLDEQVKEIEPLIRQTLDRDMSLTVTADDGIWPVRVDRSELQLALINIAVNARDAMAEGGSLDITMRNVTLSVTDSVSVTAEKLSGDFVCISIKDSGAGMSPETLARAFEPFFTTKESHNGTGLGLSHVYGFARQSGGTAVIESEPGTGTRVLIYLPRASSGNV